MKVTCVQMDMHLALTQADVDSNYAHAREMIQKAIEQEHPGRFSNTVKVMREASLGKKPVGQEWLPPFRRYSETGRVWEASQAGKTPAPEALS